MDKREKAELKITANKVRQLIIEGVFNAKSGHPGGSLSAADIFTYLLNFVLVCFFSGHYTYRKELRFANRLFNYPRYR